MSNYAHQFYVDVATQYPKPSAGLAIFVVIWNSLWFYINKTLPLKDVEFFPPSNIHGETYDITQIF